MSVTINGTTGITSPGGDNNVSLTSRPAATQDAVVVSGRAGGTSSYAVTLTPTTLSANQTLTLPDGTGTAVVNGVNGVLVSGTSKAYNWNGLTNNTYLDFTGIPSWAKRITVMFQGVSTNGTSGLLVQLGTSGGIVSSGYVSSGAFMSGSGNGASNSTAGFVIWSTGAADVSSGTMIIANITGNSWVSSHSGKRASSVAITGGGDISLAAALTQLRFGSLNGTDTLDAGTVNILYE